jgi:hypothetical protein
VGIELEKRVRVDARSEGHPGHSLARMIHNGYCRFTLYERRFTRKSGESVIAAEALMNNAG